MYYIDTHAHLYAEEYKAETQAIMERCITNKVNKILLPNIDEDSIEPMLQLIKQYPSNCFGMMGLHPCSVDENYKTTLSTIKQALFSNIEQYKAVGEIGIDLYWDKSKLEEQKEAFYEQCLWALECNLPIAIHVRSAINETLQVLKKLPTMPKGVFHCFSGSMQEAQSIVNMGFKLGIGGVVTFKNSALPETLKQIPIENILLETDAPYLSPVPFRGKRNESAYIPYIAEKIADIYGISTQQVADITTHTAEQLFAI